LAYRHDELSHGRRTAHLIHNALAAGSYEIFIGYMLIDGSGPIHFNSEGYKVDVKNLNDYASLGGVVFNADSGQPVVNAEINVYGFISGFDNVNVYSNSKGNYFVRVFADRLQGGDTFNAIAAVEGCDRSIAQSDTINVDNHAIINFILDCEDTSTTEPPTTEPPPPTTEPPTTESLSLTISSATCFVGDRFSFGAIVYNVIQVSGTASGPEGSFMNLGQGTCDSWTGTGCERLPGEPASTNWTYETTTGVWSPQSASASLFGGNGGSRFESVTFACPTN